ncbi:unnamed protein product, partial [Darwinula stevensoni]
LNVSVSPRLLFHLGRSSQPARTSSYAAILGCKDDHDDAEETPEGPEAGHSGVRTCNPIPVPLHASPGKNRGESSSWLNAYHDPLASLYTFSNCITMADIHGDGENRLIVADLGTGTYRMKLKVYKGTALTADLTLLDLPTAIVAFHMNTSEPKLPGLFACQPCTSDASFMWLNGAQQLLFPSAIAVASGSYIYIYKNLKPYFKFTLPSLDVNSTEQDLWEQVKEGKMTAMTLREMLEGLKQDIGELGLTTRSQRLLMLDPGDMAEFVQLHEKQPLKRTTVVTCMETLKKSHPDPGSVSCLVLGTESSHVYILDPDAFTILACVAVGDIPVHLAVSGLYDVDFRVLVSTRGGGIYDVRRGSEEGRQVLFLPALPVSMHLFGKTIAVAGSDGMLRSYTTQGRLEWDAAVGGTVLCSELLEVSHLGLTLWAVGLASGAVKVFREKEMVDSFRCPDGVAAMRFGRFGREDNTLVVVFQQDLYRLRLKAARTYVASLDSAATPISIDANLPLKLTTQVLGLGPTFLLRVELTNTSGVQPLTDLVVTFIYDDKLYKLHNTCIQVWGSLSLSLSNGLAGFNCECCTIIYGTKRIHYPKSKNRQNITVLSTSLQIPILIPGVSVHPESLVDFISELGIADDIQVLVLHKQQPAPCLSVLVAVGDIPVHLAVSGLYDVDFRVLVSTRGGGIYDVRRGSEEGRQVLFLPALPVSMHLFGKTIAVAGSDGMLRSYTTQGRLEWDAAVGGTVLCSELLEVSHLGLTLWAVGLASGAVKVFREKEMVDSFRCPDGVAAMRFGRFGREDNTLVVVLSNGGLMVKILRRTANFRQKEGLDSSDDEQNLRMNIPKKTKVFVDQTMRERENFVAMHQVFQQDLYRLRLKAARTYVASLDSAATPISIDANLPLKLTTQVLGLGPTFLLRVELTNTSGVQPLTDLVVTFIYDDKLYKLHNTCIQIPILIPGVSVHPESLVDFISELGIADDIQVLVLHKQQPAPCLSVLVKMPISEIAAV